MCFVARGDICPDASIAALQERVPGLRSQPVSICPFICARPCPKCVYTVILSVIHEAGSIIISIMDGEAKPERGHTHTHLDMSPGSLAPESVLLIPTLESPPLKTNHKVKMKIQGTEKTKQ